MEKEVSKWNQLNAYLQHFCQYSIDSFFINTVTVWNQNKKHNAIIELTLIVYIFAILCGRKKTQSE